MRVEPGPGQESVWDYPRPPVVVADDRRVRVWFADRLVADTRRARRVLETSQAPAWYLPPDDVDLGLLRPGSARPTWCEWKGSATYFDVVVDERIAHAAAWCYRSPTSGFTEIADHLAFYAARVDRCEVAGVDVTPNDGDFYGGWITPDVVGPFKGAAGTRGW